MTWRSRTYERGRGRPHVDGQDLSSTFQEISEPGLLGGHHGRWLRLYPIRYPFTVFSRDLDTSSNLVKRSPFPYDFLSSKPLHLLCQDIIDIVFIDQIFQPFLFDVIFPLIFMHNKSRTGVDRIYPDRLYYRLQSGNVF